MKYLLVLILGFCLHKAIEEVYDYKFEQGFQACRSQYIIDVNDPMNDAPLTKRFQCTYKHMGAFNYLEYVLIRPHFAQPKRRWSY